MIQTVAATFADGVFIPDEKLPLAPNARVRLLVEPLEDLTEATRRQQAWETLEEVWKRSKLDSQGDRLARDQLHERR